MPRIRQRIATGQYLVYGPGYAYDRRDEDELWHDLVFAATFSVMVILGQRLNGQSLSGYAWNRDALGMFVN